MNRLYCYKDYITLNPDLQHLNETEAITHWTNIGYPAMRLCNNAQLDVVSEFGDEIVLYASYYYYLVKNGLFFNNKITTYKGMKDYYYFINKANIIEKDTPRKWIPEKLRPLLLNYNAHCHKFNKKYWCPPPYKQHFKNSKFIYDKPIIIIQNKYNKEWNDMPVNFFSVNTLDTMFSLLKDKFQIIYIRPSNTILNMNKYLFSDDHNTICEQLKDFELIKSKYKNNVVLFDDLLVKENTSYNHLKLELFASCDNYISVQGGCAYFASFFFKNMLILHKKGSEIRAGEYSGWFMDTYPVANKNLQVAKTDSQLIELLDIFTANTSPPRIFSRGNTFW
jgi:hypothetical protein